MRRKTEDVCRRMPQEGGDEEKNENRGTGGSVMKRKTATMSGGVQNACVNLRAEIVIIIVKATSSV